MTVHTVKSCI